MKVLIIGAGPSAIFAHEACKDLGIKARVISKAKVAPSNGAFWLHWVPKSYRMANLFSIGIRGVGTEKIYLEKQWGKSEGILSSFPKDDRAEVGYKSDVLNQMSVNMTVRLTDTVTDEELGKLAHRYAHVFMTGPLQRSKAERMVTLFPVAKISDRSWQRKFCEDFNEKFHTCFCEQWDKCTYLGIESPFVRASMLHGNLFIEMSPKTDAYFIDLMREVYLSEIFTMADIAPWIEPWDPTDVPAPNIHLIGRFATWNRKVLSSDAYFDVWRTMTGENHEEQPGKTMAQAKDL